MPYLTPDSIPEETDCRSLLIPASTDWLALVSGALTELTKTWNWEQFGAVTVEEAVAAMQTMIDEYYEGCQSCTLPGGGKVLRINEVGRVQELQGEEWVEPTGDYEIPPVEPREGGTPDDQICLAAKNSVNSLQLLYENLSDSWNGDLDAAEAVLAIIGVIVGILGAEFAPITYSLYLAGAGIFGILFSAVEFAIADLWDEDFTSQLICILRDCASNEAGVVTFDWDCFNHALSGLQNDFSLTSEQLRLYFQLQLLLSVIGGVDALNRGGATTAITDDQCDCGWCYEWVEATLEDDWVFDFGTNNGDYFVDLHIDFGGTLRINSAVMEVCVDATDPGQVAGWWTTDYGSRYNDQAINFGCENEIAVAGFPGDVDGLAISCAPASGTSGSIRIVKITLTGDGNNPFGVNNCDVE